MSPSARSRAVHVTLGMLCGLAFVMRSTLRAFIAPVAESPGFLLSSLPPLSLVAAGVGAGAAAGLWLGRKQRAFVLTPFAVAGALATAVLVPGLYRVWPFVAAFSGRFLDFALVTAALWLVVRTLLGRSRSVRPRPVVVFLLALGVFLVAGAKTSRDVGLSGDEPHYLLITYSLIHDHDLAVQNNYGAEDYRSFFAGTLGAHLAEGSPFSIHGVGVPILLLPGFALFGLVGVLVTEALVAAALVAACFVLCRQVTDDGAASLVGALACGLTAPGLFLATSAYPELPAALVVALVSFRLTRPAPSLSPAWGLLVGTLPFFHMKYAPLAVVLAAALVYRFRERRPALAATLGASAAVFLVFGFVLTGSLDPTAAYGRQRIFWSAVPIGLAGLLFDQEFGLLANAPIYFLGFAGLRTLRERAPFFALVGLAVILAVALPGAAHPLWSGGTSPPARFLFPAAPVLACAVATTAASRRGLASWTPALLAVSLAIAGAMLVLTPQPLYLNGRDGTSNVLEALSSSWPLADYAPSLVRAHTHDYVWAIALGTVVGASILRRGADLLGRLSPVGLVLLTTWVNDWTPRVARAPLEARWSADVLHALAGRRAATFLALPSGERLDAAEVMARVSLPLAPVARDGDPRHWWSRPYALPAGTFEIDGVFREGAAIANGAGLLHVGTTRFTSRVALSRFRLRARRLESLPRVRLVALDPGSPPAPEASQSIALESGQLLHGLDDGAHLDPIGFWTRPGRPVAFYLENENGNENENANDGADEGGSRLEIAAGAVDTWVRLDTLRGSERFHLKASGRKTIIVPPGRFIVESESGFTPAEHDARSDDRRRLGVLLATPPAFDLSP